MDAPSSHFAQDVIARPAISAPLARIYLDALTLATSHAALTEAVKELPDTLAAQIAAEVIAARDQIRRIERAARRLVTWEQIARGLPLPDRPCTAVSPEGDLYCVGEAGHDGPHLHPGETGPVRWRVATVITREATPAEIKEVH